MNINEKIYRELRCAACRKLICYEYIFAGRISFHCPRCGELTEMSFKHVNTKGVTDTMDEYIVNKKEVSK